MNSREKHSSLEVSLRRHPLFASLSREVCREIVDKSVVYYLDADELLYTSGDPADRIFSILEGAIQIEYPNHGEARGRVAAMLSAPCFLGECQVLHGRLWSGTGVALVPIVALGIRKEELQRTFLNHPDFAFNLYRELALRFMNAIEAWRKQPVRTPTQTLARYILGYLEMTMTPVKKGKAEVKLRQSVLGCATGLRRETVNRLLRVWVEEKRIKMNPQAGIEIKIARLEELLDKNGIADLSQTVTADIYRLPETEERE